MDQKIRLQVALNPSRRSELEQLAKEAGMSSADVARLAIGWIIANREILLAGMGRSQQAA